MLQRNAAGSSLWFLGAVLATFVALLAYASIEAIRSPQASDPARYQDYFRIAERLWRTRGPKICSVETREPFTGATAVPHGIGPGDELPETLGRELRRYRLPLSAFERIDIEPTAVFLLSTDGFELLGDPPRQHAFAAYVQARFIDHPAQAWLTWELAYAMECSPRE